MFTVKDYLQNIKSELFFSLEVELGPGSGYKFFAQISFFFHVCVFKYTFVVLNRKEIQGLNQHLP